MRPSKCCLGQDRRKLLEYLYMASLHTERRSCNILCRQRLRRLGCFTAPQLRCNIVIGLIGAAGPREFLKSASHV